MALTILPNLHHVPGLYQSERKKRTEKCWQSGCGILPNIQKRKAHRFVMSVWMMPFQMRGGPERTSPSRSMLQVVPHSQKKTSATSTATQNRADDIPRAALIHQRSGARNRILVSARIFDRFGGGRQSRLSSVVMARYLCCLFSPGICG